MVSQRIQDNFRYLRLLSKQYPTIQSVCTEIINLHAILNLPKGTEHFISDLHGEYEAVNHIMNNCSGVIREKVDELGDSCGAEQRRELCTLIYYPEKKLASIKKTQKNMDSWYETTLLNMVEVCKSIAKKYTRSKVRKAMPQEFSYILDELVHAVYNEESQSAYYNEIMESILALGIADEFIVAMALLIKRLAVDRLHVVGDIFDRGSRPDLIMDMLIDHHSVDIQWGNHDILWMGAAAGSPACMAAVVTNCVAYGNLRVLEEGYGINLRPLALFAEKTYSESACFQARNLEKNQDPRDRVLAGKIYKAISIILFKLEGQLWKRHPEYGMESRLLLDKIDYQQGTINLNGTVHPLKDWDFPTMSTADPYALSQEESRVVRRLMESFRSSERLERHVRFLYSHGSMYAASNQNLMFHGCIPMNEDGTFTAVELMGEKASGRALMDLADVMARTAFFGKGEDKERACDGMWYLWCGKQSPVFGRDRMTTFERLLVADKSTWAENDNPYYNHIESEDACIRILEEFGLFSKISHIVNGHVPVRAADGESPVKGGGKRIVIDGGFCKAYQPRTGIAGYTLIYNSYGLRLSAHKSFESTAEAVENNLDIHSTTQVFETMRERMMVKDTDVGQDISDQIYDLSLLLSAYRTGAL